ncbi:MAG: DUF3500 domain-containing protein [Bryobacteraceae bacterium]
MPNTNNPTRRSLIQSAGASAGLLTLSPANDLLAAPGPSNTDPLAMQLYKSLSDAQKEKICLPADHPKRRYIHNFWFIHPDHRVPTTFTPEQQELIRNIFDSLHSPEHREGVKKQVITDQYGDPKNAPSAGFFGTPADQNFEFILTGHHVIRRCNARSHKGLGFNGAPIFYGHFPYPGNVDGQIRREAGRMAGFIETQDHPGNPYWYQGKIFNRFVQSLNGRQQQMGLIAGEPRVEQPDKVVQIASEKHGLPCSELSKDQKKFFVESMRSMLSMFRKDDVNATIDTIRNKNVLDNLTVSWFSGKYDVGSDKVWDTWQIEGPNMVWYFRGIPHIHCYFHLKA